MITDRRDLRPMTITPAELRPGMVLCAPWGENITLTPQTVTDIRIFWTQRADKVRILGEEVRGREIAADDLVSVGKRWHAADGSPYTFSPSDTYIRAYVDPAWELAQAQQ